MNGLKKTLGMAGMAAMLMASTTPAMARPGWGGGWGGHGGGYRGFGGYGHYHHGGDGFGNFLLGAIVAGGIVAVASSASRSDREARVVEGPSGRPDHSNWSDSESDAANICADAAQDLASKRGLDAHVDDVDTVDPDEADGYRVEGRLDNGKDFTCGVNRGELTYIQFSDPDVASRY